MNPSFSTSLIQGSEIENLIPQRPPIVMIDRFYGMDENGSYTGLTIDSENLFTHDEQLDECGLIEHIAQSAAARIGYIYKNRQEPIPLGYIGSVNKMHIRRLPKTGEELHTTIRIKQEIFDITLVSATVQVNTEIIAEGQLKIFLKKES